jgi:hypothetical protein
MYKREPLSTKSHSSAPPADDVFLFLLFLLQTLLVVAKSSLKSSFVVVKVRRRLCVFNAPPFLGFLGQKKERKKKLFVNSDD